MKVAFLVPWRTDNGGRRDHLWDFTSAWMHTRYPVWRIHTADSDEGPFNRGQAINRAAADAGQWDIAIIHDADNICDPLQLAKGIQWAENTGVTVFPYEAYMYLDEHSTNRIMKHDPWFACPWRRDDNYEHTLRHHHYSGIQIITRQTWEKVGGFIELKGWGAEDAIMKELFDVYANGCGWQHGVAYHLWHEPVWKHGDQEIRRMSTANHTRLGNIQRRRHNPIALRAYLHSIGHTIP
jgi:hypothetical protein